MHGAAHNAWKLTGPQARLLGVVVDLVEAAPANLTAVLLVATSGLRSQYYRVCFQAGLQLCAQPHYLHRPP